MFRDHRQSIHVEHQRGDLGRGVDVLGDGGDDFVEGRLGAFRGRQGLCREVVLLLPRNSKLLSSSSSLSRYRPPCCCHCRHRQYHSGEALLLDELTRSNCFVTAIEQKLGGYHGHPGKSLPAGRLL